MSETVATTAPETTPTPTPAETPAEPTLLAPAAPETPAAPVVPEKYEFAAPEGVTVDPEALTGFEVAAREAGLTQAQFAAIAPLGAQLIASKVAAAMADALPAHLRPDTQTAWADAVRNDPEIGGDKLAPSLAQAAKVIDAYGGAALREALNVTRAGNNPAVVKAFIAIGKAMGDAEGLSVGKPATAKVVSQEAAARDFYNSRGGSYAPMEG